MTSLRAIAAFAVLAGSLLVTGGAAAQTDLDIDFDDSDSVFEDFDDDRGFDDDAEDFIPDVEECDDDSFIGLLTDVSRTEAESTSFEQDVDFEEDDLLWVALANNGLGDGDAFDVADRSVTRESTADLTQTTDLDRDDVLLAIALGGDDAGDGGSLVCAADVDFAAEVTETADRDFMLDEDDALLGIALSRNGDNDFGLDDLVSGSEDTEREVTVERHVDIDRDAALLLLVLD